MLDRLLLAIDRLLMWFVPTPTEGEKLELLEEAERRAEEVKDTF